jgi:hypothetical protein
VTLLRRYWRWLGRWLRLSQPGRALFTAAFLLGFAEIVYVRAQGDREGGAPGVVLALVLAGVVVLDAVGRGVVAVARRLT